MGNSRVRQPKQKRAIEKKEKIIQAGFKLFSEKGFHNTNTAEIAKAAGVSTGILYSYFVDKKDIFLAAVESYGNSITVPTFAMINNLEGPPNLNELVRLFINAFIKSHYMAKATHEEMQAMAHLDQDVAELFNKFDVETAHKVVGLIKQLGFTPENPYEKVHIAISMVENLCHEIVYNKHEGLNYEVMIEEVIGIIAGMLKK